MEVLGGKNSKEKNGTSSPRAAILSVIFSMMGAWKICMDHK
jgi:hypothetical protein